MVSIPMERYRELILIEDRCVMMLKAAYQDARLSCDHLNRLSLDVSSLESYLRFMDTERYLMIYEQLLKGERHDGTN